MFTSRDLSREAFGSTARYGLNHLILRCWWVNICVIYIDFSNWNVRFHPFFQHPRQKREWGRTNLSATITSINYGETSFNLALTALMLLKIIDNLRGSAPIEKAGQGGQSGWPSSLAWIHAKPNFFGLSSNGSAQFVGIAKCMDEPRGKIISTNRNLSWGVNLWMKIKVPISYKGKYFFFAKIWNHASILMKTLYKHPNFTHCGVIITS